MGEQLSFLFNSDAKTNTQKNTHTPVSSKSKKIEKVYYSIGEVAQLLKVSSSLIRFWENEFPALKPKKNARGVRKFKKKDIDLLKLIYHLVKEKGYTLNGAKEALKKSKDEVMTQQETIEHLKNIRKFLVEIKSKL